MYPRCVAFVLLSIVLLNSSESTGEEDAATLPSALTIDYLRARLKDERYGAIDPSNVHSPLSAFERGLFLNGMPLELLLDIEIIAPWRRSLSVNNSSSQSIDIFIEYPIGEYLTLGRRETLQRLGIAFSEKDVEHPRAIVVATQIVGDKESVQTVIVSIVTCDFFNITSEAATSASQMSCWRNVSKAQIIKRIEDQ